MNKEDIMFEIKAILSLAVFTISALITGLFIGSKTVDKEEITFNKIAIEKGLIQYQGDWVTEEIAKLRINLNASINCYNNRYDYNMEECCNKINKANPNSEIESCCSKGEMLY